MSTDMDFVSLERENVPCLYELSFEPKTPAIIVRAHKDFLAKAPVIHEAPIINCLKMELGFDSFAEDILYGNFGFNGVFQRIGEENGFVVFKVEIPVLRKPEVIVCPLCAGDKRSFFGKCDKCKGKGCIVVACPDCQGSKENEFGQKCFECFGRGIKIKFDSDPLYAISGTFNVFFNMAALQHTRDKMTSCQFPQLILVNFATEKKMHGGSLDGTYSIQVARHLSNLGAELVDHQHCVEVTEMAEAMAVVWKKLFGELDNYDKHQLTAWVTNNNGWLNVKCPGDACVLHPADQTGPKKGKGYEFSCHNVDNPWQQLTLLASLAVLCDMVRKEPLFSFDRAFRRA